MPTNALNTEMTPEQIVDENKTKKVLRRTPFEKQKFYFINPGEKIEIVTEDIFGYMKFSVFEKKSTVPIFEARARSSNFENRPDNLLHAFFECINQLPVSKNRQLARSAILLSKVGHKLTTIFYFTTTPQTFS